MVTKIRSRMTSHWSAGLRIPSIAIRASDPQPQPKEEIMGIRRVYDGKEESAEEPTQPVEVEPFEDDGEVDD